MKDFNFQLFGVLRGSTLRFDGSPLLFLTFYSNQSGRGVTSDTLGNFKPMLIIKTLDSLILMMVVASKTSLHFCTKIDFLK